MKVQARVEGHLCSVRWSSHAIPWCLEFPDVARQDERRIEVIANGLALWGGSQLAVDTTLVSPLTSAGGPRRAKCSANLGSTPTLSSGSLPDASASRPRSRARRPLEH